MLTYITEKHTVFYPDFRIFTSKCVDEISTYIKLQKKEKTYNSVVIDMSKIQVLTTEFFDLINGCPNKIILINTSAEILAVLNLMGYDKKLKLFVNNIDMEEDRRELRNRKFHVV